jgi:hypothetical protein
MDDSSGLGVSFQIDFGDSFGGLRTLDDLIGKTSAEAVREFQRLEAAVSGGLGLPQAAQQFRELEAASTRSTRAIARDAAQVERVGEGLVRSLQKQNAEFGKSRTEIQATRIEEAALAAERVRNSALAGELRSELALLTQQQTQARAAAEAEAQARREAAHAYELFETRARAGAIAMREAAAAEAQLSREAVTVRAALDPMYAAQQRFDSELERAERLLAANRLSQREYAQEVQRARDALYSHAQSVAGSGQAMDRLADRQQIAASAAGAHRQAMQGLSFQAQDTFTQLSMGANPLSVLAIQGGQAAGQMANLGGKMGAVATFMIGPWGLAITAVLLGLGALWKALSDNADASGKAAGALTEHEKAAKALTDAVERLNGGQAALNRTTRQGIIDDLNASEAKRQLEIRTRGALDALLREQQAKLGAARATEATPGGTVPGGGLIGRGSATLAWEIKETNDALARNAALIEKANTAIRGGRGRIISRDVAAATDRATAAAQRYSDEVDRLTRLHDRGSMSDAKYRAEMLSTTRARDAALERIKESEAAAGKAATAANKAAAAARREAAQEMKEYQKELDKLAALARNPGAGLDVAAIVDAPRRALDASKRTYSELFGEGDLLAGVVQADPLKAKWDAADEAAAEKHKALHEGLRLTADLAEEAGDAMSRSFGRAGGAIGEVLRTLGRYGEERQRIADAMTAGDITAQNAARRTAALQVGAFGDIIGAAKSMAKEGTGTYRALAAAEKAYRAVQFAMSVQAMVQNALETTGIVSNAAIKATAEGTAGIAKQSQLPFPANIAAMAATAAALVAAGIAVFGGGGGAAAPVTNTGTGTVLGDRSAQSESIKRSIDALREVDTLMLTSSRDMAASLRSIDSQIGGLASLVVRSGDINASAGVTEGFKMNAVGSVLSKIPLIGGILGGLFGSKTTVVGSGLFGKAQSLDSILGDGFDASYYSDVEKKKKLFGITTGTKRSTTFTGADDGLEQQFTLILRGFYDSIGAAAGPLGTATSEIEARLRGFVVNIGKIDLQGLTGAEIEEKLTAVFGAAADNMASAAFPGVERFQRVGEGAFETLVRVASTVESVTASLDMLGSGARGLAIDAKMALADQFDSLGDLTGAAQSYFETFYSKQEQAAARAAQFATVFDSLGLAMPNTLAGFRSLVEAQNLTTASGQSTYATLLQLAPAFAELASVMDGAKSAADILSERQDLERKLLELRGDTATIRALDLAKLDVSNRGLQEQIYAVQDAQAAAAAAKQLQDAWKSVGDTIMDEVKRIRGLTGGAGEGSFASLLGQFNAATSAARGGNQDAAKSLPGLSQALLKVAADTATSRQELARVQAQTAASLEATYGVIGALTGAGTSSTGSTLSAAATAAQATAAPATANEDRAEEVRALRTELAAMRADINTGLATVAGNTGRTARKLEDVTSASGGDAISVTSVAA